MLTELRVRDLAVIADVTLPLGPGLNVITGETGAGKSILIDALSLLLGERATVDLVRPGTDKAVVEAAFEVGGRAFFRQTADEAGVELDDGRFVAKREIHAEGRNRAWANGSPTTVGVLATLGRLLVDLHGQHESQSLLRPGTQRDLLDAFAGAGPERERVLDCFKTLQSVRAEESDLVARRDDVRKRADYLRHVVGEIDDAMPVVGEDEELSAEIRRLANAEQLTELSEQLVELLDGDEGSVSDGLGRALRIVAQLERLDDAVARWRTSVDELETAAQELARDVRAYAADLEIDPGRLAQAEERRDVLYALMRKYGAGIDAVLQTGADARRELDLLDSVDLDLGKLAERRAAAEAEIARVAAVLSEKRTLAAERLARAVDELLPGLGLPDGRLIPHLSRLEEAGPTGQDGLTLRVQLNPGLGAKPLAQVASGGELSRIMLALKVVLAREDAVPTLIFDEVDQGIGGETAGSVAAALAEAARTRQVLVITHLPQIAARASRHIAVTKSAVRGVATVSARVLDDGERVRELARMLGNATDETALQHARELIKTR